MNKRRMDIRIIDECESTFTEIEANFDNDCIISEDGHILYVDGININFRESYTLEKIEG